MKKNLNICLHGFDMGPSKNLHKVAGAALTRGHRLADVLNRRLGSGHLITDDTDVLVTGISSFKGCRGELWLGREAKKYNIPWLVVADTHGTCVRPTAFSWINNAIAVIASPLDKGRLKNFGYSDIQYLGGPPDWYDFYFEKPNTKNLKQGQDFKTVLVGGIKDAEITDDLLNVVAKAMKLLGGKYKIIFKLHPNEWEHTKDEKRRLRILEDIPLLDIEYRLDDILGSVDISIHTSGATATIKAPCMRRPVIYYENKAVRARVKTQTGSPDWPPVTYGACLLARDVDEMAKQIAFSFLPENAAKLAEKQKEVYPTPAGDKRPEQQIVEFIEKLGA